MGQISRLQPFLRNLGSQKFIFLTTTMWNDIYTEKHSTMILQNFPGEFAFAFKCQTTAAKKIVLKMQRALVNKMIGRYNVLSTLLGQDVNANLRAIFFTTWANNTKFL